MDHNLVIITALLLLERAVLPCAKTLPASMLFLRLLAILGHQFECVSHLTMRYAGSESGPVVCGSLGDLACSKSIFPVSMSTSCPLKTRGKPAWGTQSQAENTFI